MAGLLDALGSYSGDDTTKDQFGQTQADRRQPLWSGLIKAGLLGVAAGGNLMPADRAKYIAEAGGAIGDIQPQMQAQQTNAMQNLLRQQQVQTSQVEMQGKQADIAQQAQWRTYAGSPEFKQAMDSANATPAERMAAQAAAMKGDFATVSKVLDPKRNMPQVSGNLIRLSDGSVVTQTGRVVVGPDGKPPTGQTNNEFDPTKPNVGGTDRLNMTALQGQPHDIAVQALQVARGEIAPPTVRTNPDAALINQLASQVAGPNGTAFKVRQGFESSITSGGTTDKLVISPWSKMMQHGQAAQKAYDELAHTDGGKWSALLDKGSLNRAMITDPNVLRLVTEFQTEMGNFVDEGKKLIVGSGALPVEAMKAVEGLNDPSRSPSAQIGTMQGFVNMTKPVMDQLLANGRRVRHDSSIQLKDLGINPDSLVASDYLQQRFLTGPGTGKPAATTPQQKPGQVPTGKTPEGKPVYTHSDGKQYLEPE